MTNLKIAAVAVALGALGSVSASAAVVPTAALAPAAKTGMIINASAFGTLGAARDNLSQRNVEEVRRHRGRYYRPRYRSNRWVAPAIIGGVAALIIGGSIRESQARHRDRWEMCADRYQSFSWADGTFQPYEGPRRVCPYLVN